ncbi:hypothetical protein Droror1_Dr00019017 [Drosera rotundifolia]
MAQPAEAQSQSAQAHSQSAHLLLLGGAADLASSSLSILLVDRGDYFGRLSSDLGLEFIWSRGFAENGEEDVGGVRLGGELDASGEDRDRAGKGDEVEGCDYVVAGFDGY